MQQEALYGVEQAGHQLARLLDSGRHLVRQLHAKRLDSTAYVTAWCSLDALQAKCSTLAIWAG